MERKRLKVHWVTKEHDMVANALGYNTHNKFMRKYCSEVMEFDENANRAVTITPADQFIPLKRKFNFLFTMWEFLDLPQSYIEGINKADVVVVPSRFCKDLFRKYTDKPIEVCWEGVEAEKFPYYEREFPNIRAGERFRYLWVGAPNPRKGYPLILEAIKMVEKTPYLELYIKTTMPTVKWKRVFKRFWENRHIFMKHPRAIKKWLMHFKNAVKMNLKPYFANQIKIFGRYGNIIFDSRILPFEDLVKLYNSAHCFLLPTFGEGWGLTLCEAMATGAPCIATAVTGCADFFDDSVGYTLDYEIKEHDLKNYDLRTRMFVPDTHDLIKKMLYVFSHYPEALKKGKKASTRIHNKFTWKRSALRLAEIIGKYLN